MFFFALFGVRPRLKDAESPERVVVPCPVCLGERNFERKQARTWFELFFVPIFPIGAVRDLFTCVTCGVGLEPEIVRSRAAREFRRRSTRRARPYTACTAARPCVGRVNPAGVPFGATLAGDRSRRESRVESGRGQDVVDPRPEIGKPLAAAGGSVMIQMVLSAARARVFTLYWLPALAMVVGLAGTPRDALAAGPEFSEIAPQPGRGGARFPVLAWCRPARRGTSRVIGRTPRPRPGLQTSGLSWRSHAAPALRPKST